MGENQEPKQVQGDCPMCGADRWANVLGEKLVEDRADEDAGIWSSDTYRLLECAGCRTPYFQHVSRFSQGLVPIGRYDEMILIPRTTYFPPPSKRNPPDWFAWNADHDLVELLRSLYIALDNDLTVLAASGVRTVFDVATAKLGIDAALTFDEKIEALKAQGRNGRYEQEDLVTMVGAANAAMHRGWTPSPGQLDAMMSTLERFIHHSFVLKGSTEKLKESVPPKPKRKKLEAK